MVSSHSHFWLINLVQHHFPQCVDFILFFIFYRFLETSILSRIPETVKFYISVGKDGTVRGALEKRPHCNLICQPEYVLVHQNMYQYYFTVPFFCDLFCFLHTGEPGGTLKPQASVPSYLCFWRSWRVLNAGRTALLLLKDICL